MGSRTGILFMLTLLLAGLAGCIGGDDAIGSDDTQQEQTQADKGRIAGRILTVDLDPVPGASVSLVTAQSEAVQNVTADDDGRYAIENVEPGEYRLQVNAPCCREAIRVVSVSANEETTGDFQIEPLTNRDLRAPYVEKLQWNGFISCSVRWQATGGPLPYSALSACSLFDPSDDFLHNWEILEGVQTIVGGMVWDRPAAGVAEDLAIIMEVGGLANQDPTYAREDGPSPQEWRVEAGYVEENYDEDLHQYDFNNVDGSLGMMYRLFAGGNVNVVYQQEVSVYWDLYYWEAAPEDASALPDL